MVFPTAVTTENGITKRWVMALAIAGVAAILTYADWWCISLTPLPYSGVILTLGTIPLFIKLPFQRGASALRMVLWIFGLFVWFVGGFVSYGHAPN